jgi:leader peptidase (prepilin peptidase)/N-methyltransferase
MPESPLALIVAPPYGWGLAAVWGALWGSFFNVCIHRVGLYESVMRPPSRCPSCGAPIQARDNIPIVSWLVLGGRCRHCRTPISIRYPLVEALACALSLAVYARFVAGEEGATAWLLARYFVDFAFLGVLLVLAGIDLDHKLIPDRITYPAIPVFLVAAILLGEVPTLDLVIGAVLGYGMVAVTAEIAFLILGREAMGYGDAKLLALVGALTGWRGVVFTFFGAPFAGLLIVVPLLLRKRGKVVGVEVPYGPFLAVAATLYLFFIHNRPLSAALPFLGGN